MFMQSGKQKLRVVFRPPPGTSAPTSRTLPIMTFCTRGMQTQSGPTASRPAAKASAKSKAKPRPADAKGSDTKPKTRTQQKRSEQGTIWRANKKHAVDNFGPILDNYPGCRRWKPVFQQSKKKDDLADAALHAIFLLKAGGTRLARTKTLDDASLIVLSGPSGSGSDVETTPVVVAAAAVRQKGSPAASDGGRVIDLTGCRGSGDDDGSDSLTDDEEEDDDDDVILCPDDEDDDEEEEKDADDSLSHGEDDRADDDDDIVIRGAPWAKRRRVDTSAAPCADSTASDDSWSEDLGICASRLPHEQVHPSPPPRRASVVRLATAAGRRHR